MNGRDPSGEFVQFLMGLPFGFAAGTYKATGQMLNACSNAKYNWGEIGGAAMAPMMVGAAVLLPVKGRFHGIHFQLIPHRCIRMSRLPARIALPRASASSKWTQPREKHVLVATPAFRGVRSSSEKPWLSRRLAANVAA